MKTPETTKESQALGLAIKTVVNNWDQQTKAITDFFVKQPESDYLIEVAPNRNKAAYLLGHIIATNDGLLPLLGFEERLFPELDAYFTPNTEWNYDDFPSLKEWQEKWDLLNKTLSQHFNTLEPYQWLERHTKVSPEDFEIDSTRNKLNIIIGRTLHMRYHLGQLNLIKF